MGSRITLEKFLMLNTLGNPLSDDLDTNFLNKNTLLKILRKDKVGIRSDCHEYQPSPIKMKTRSIKKSQPRVMFYFLFKKVKCIDY